MGFFDFLSNKTTPSSNTGYKLTKVGVGLEFPYALPKGRECSVFEFVPNIGPCLITYYKAPSSGEINAWENGEISLRFAGIEDKSDNITVLLFISKFANFVFKNFI